MGFIVVVLGFVGVLLLAALGDLISEEVRGWLDLVPRGILRLAAGRLDPAQRDSIYQDEWLPELSYALRGAESRPITRLVLGMRYALGLLIAARRISRLTGPGARAQPVEAAHSPVVVEQYCTFTNTSGRAIMLHHSEGVINIANGNSFQGTLSLGLITHLLASGVQITTSEAIISPRPSSPS
jgi:hypothetical protein